MSLNEKLATEVMGLRELGGVYLHIHRPTTEWTWSDDYDAFYYPKVWWNPLQDLNQLKMCYEAAEKDWDADAKGESFARKFTKCLNRVIVEFTDGKLGRDDFDDFVSSVWVKHPELVAQAILRAKGVEL